MDQAELLRFALDCLENLQITYMVVGSFASGAYGEPRLTLDLDIVISATQAQLESLCASFPSDSFYVSLDAARDAMNRGGQFSVIHPESGNKIDFMFAQTDDWGREQLARREVIELLPKRPAYLARPEDIILSKMLYYKEGGSEKHLRDITGILKTSGDSIDRSYIHHWSTHLKTDEIWTAILRRLQVD